MIIIDGTMGRMVPATGVYGVIPANFAALGTSPSPLVNDADLPGDANTQWMWMLLPSLPGVGTTQANDQGGYAFFGAPPGLYTQGYRGFTVSPSGTVVVYDTSISTTVESGIGTVQQDRALAWSVRAFVNRDQALAWSVKNLAQRDQVLSWSIEQSFVTSDLTLSFSTMGTVQSDRLLAFAIRSSAQRDRLFRWAVRSSLTPNLRRFKVTLQVNSVIK